MELKKNKLAIYMMPLLAATMVVGCSDDDDDDDLVCTPPEIINEAGDMCIDPPVAGEEPVTAGANETVIYLLDPTQQSTAIADDSPYQAYSMYAWQGTSGGIGDGVSCDALADSEVSSGWDDESRIPDGEDEHGPYWVLDLGSEEGCIHFIVRQNIDDSIQNITGSDGRVVFADFPDRTVTMIRNSADLYDSRVNALEIMNAVEVSGFAAHWVEGATLLWSAGDVAESVSLYTSADASFDLNEEGVISGNVTEVALTSGELSEGAAAKFPHISGLTAWAVPDTLDAKAALKGQLVAVAKNANGDVVGATMVQTPGVLDALYADGEGGANSATLGAVIGDSGTSFNLWAPTAQNVHVRLYNADKTEMEGSPIQMIEDGGTGIWIAEADAPSGTFYRYDVTVYHHISDAIENYEVTDPYSWSLSTNSLYSQVLDFDSEEVTPDGWAEHTVPTSDHIVIYEAHIRDFSALDETTSAENRGRYGAFTEAGSDPMLHLAKLAEAGLTHFHLMPAFDIATVDEDVANRVDITDTIGDLCRVNANARICGNADDADVIKDVLAACDPATACAEQIVTDMAQYDSFNWGYDPYHYGAPEGSYSSNPEGVTRVKEFREMVQALHGMGLRVTMDVVYNHTNASGITTRSVLDRLVPGYYHRRNAESGAVEQSTCCDNTATEYTMMAKLMKDTLVVWADEYKIDAFRFDLMGHQPLAAMEDSLAAVLAVDEDNYFYGEGWNFGEVANDARFVQATQENLAGTGIGSFSDRMRDAVRGGRFNTENHRSAQGWASGLHTAQNEDFPASDATLVDLEQRSDQIRVELAGGLRDFILVDYEGNTSRGQDVLYGSSPSGYVDAPEELVSYISKHDNQTFWDFNQYKIAEGETTENRLRMHGLGVSMPLLSQSVPFIHMGVEFLRSKSMSRDSYDSGDWYNEVDFTGMTSRWNVGLPLENRDVDNWPLIQEIIADPAAEPQVEHIAAATELFFDFLAVRGSTPLFALNAAQIKSRIDFRNVGDDHKLHLIVMSIDDGISAGEDLDANNDAVVVVYNGAPEEQTFTLGAGNWELHPALAGSADYNTLYTSTVDGNAVTVSAYTPAVFVLPQDGAQGAGWAVNEDNKDLSQIPPFGNTAVFLRGDMNGWDTTDQLTFDTNGRYLTVVTLEAGTYGFKVADATWTDVNYGAAGEDGTVTLGTPIAIAAGSQTNLSLTLADNSIVTFVADFSNLDAPMLTVTAEAVESCEVLADSAEVGPLGDTKIALIGNLSNWDYNADYEFSYKGSNTYQLQLTDVAIMGADGFKMRGDADWNTQFNITATNAAVTDVRSDIVYDLTGAVNLEGINLPNNNTTLATEGGTYNYTVVFNDGADLSAQAVQGTFSMCEVAGE
ncbi:pullulanase-type alpha-1,6-glucosidase [Corallincola spongiicola]|uniref:Pullulanase-type alpha-1,6-glucosidase n=1 Tax=Corallincola spongiicola TaxID=2520508 RepID=A0ABY1WKS0_9GAMM|nr:pullulanase-type alpha-1,6-glucosidase [Corallincola spongiicola]TAA40387.1 pullulanase-type alpha-1,6-glucosidase [Corallincola spongiicola]